MAKPTPPSERRYTGPYLSDLPGLKIFVVCERCKIRKRFDGMAMLERIDEDCNMPTLLPKIRQGMNCEVHRNHRNHFDPQCQLVYDAALMDSGNPGIKHRAG